MTDSVDPEVNIYNLYDDIMSFNHRLPRVAAQLVRKLMANPDDETIIERIRELADNGRKLFDLWEKHP